MPVHKSVTRARVVRMVKKDQYEGICLACGKTAKNVEPDARHYECEKCKKKAVFGAEELLMHMGLCSFSVLCLEFATMPQFSLKFPNEHSVQDAENPFKFHPSELEVIYKYEYECKAWMIKGEDTIYSSVVVIAKELEKRIENPYCDWATLTIYLEQLRVMEMTMTHITEQQWDLAEYEENGKLEGRE